MKEVQHDHGSDTTSYNFVVAPTGRMCAGRPAKSLAGIHVRVHPENPRFRIRPGLTVPLVEAVPLNMEVCMLSGPLRIPVTDLRPVDPDNQAAIALLKKLAPMSDHRH